MDFSAVSGLSPSYIGGMTSLGDHTTKKDTCEEGCSSYIPYIFF